MLKLATLERILELYDIMSESIPGHCKFTRDTAFDFIAEELAAFKDDLGDNYPVFAAAIALRFPEEEVSE